MLPPPPPPLTHIHTGTHVTHALKGTIFLRVPKYIRCDLLLITRILSNYFAPLMILLSLITHKIVLPSTYRLNIDNAGQVHP